MSWHGARPVGVAARPNAAGLSVSIRTALRLWSGLDSLDHHPNPQVASPWQRDTLETLVWSDLLDTTLLPVTRAQAMAVPAVSRAQMLICSTIGRLPLRALTGPTVDPVQPAWTTRTDQLSTPFHRMLDTVDDHLFYGDTLWCARNGFDGRALEFEHVRYADWSVDPGSGIVLLEDGYPRDLVVYMRGPHEGLLTKAAHTIRMATLLDKTALDNAQHPFRVELHQTGGAAMADSDIKHLIDQARTALYLNGGVMYTNQSLEAKLHTFDTGEAMAEGRNLSAVDIARHAGIPAALLDATVAAASLTYETTQGRNQQFVDYGLSAYMAPIESRLSMDDIVPAGHRVAFDTTTLTSLTPAATGPDTKD